MKRVGVGLLALLASCGATSPDPFEFEFVLHRPASGEFSFQSTIAVDQSVNGVDHATLSSVTLEAVSPAGTTLDFLELVQADALVHGEHTPLVAFAATERETSVAPLTILYEKDLRPLFPDGHTIVIAWHGEVAPNVSWPIDGFRIRIRITIAT